ncbi:MAG: acetolactate synthase small subunit [Chloroflexota bacterium]|jgi:acetolactate synthase-1/3 small subunit|nr:acetolactate synthase small subunit [Chloroflexota bacterium]
MEHAHTLVVLVEDQPGVLNRVVSLLRRRSFNIDSITVGHSEQPGMSRMTLVVRGEDADVEQAGKQLYKLLEVMKVTDLSEGEAITREMVMVKVAAKGQSRSEILQIAQVYNARVLDATPTTLMIEATGDEAQIDSFLTMMRVFGIREMVRSGKIAMSRTSGTSRQGKSDAPSNGVYAAAD